MTQYTWTVIGAGPAGIAAVGRLLDHGRMTLPARRLTLNHIALRSCLRSPKATSPRTPPSTARNHGLIRNIATDRWCLTVGGLVER